jgi:RNA-directed DNA polymerase
MSNTESENSQVEWNQIDWRKVETSIFKLQKRIYQASLSENLKLLRKLQRTLTRSWYGKLLAVRRVTQDNKGRKTAGIDGVKSLTPKRRVALAQNLKLDGKARPTRRVWIPKPLSQEKRPLGIPTIEDRAKQTLLKMALEPEWEAKFEPNSFGFRSGRSCHDAVRTIVESINQKQDGKYVLDADISKCFDRISHEKLLAKINTSPTYTKQIKAWLKAGVIDKKDWFATSEGTPQGGSISPLLANIALHGMEKVIEEAFPSDKGGRLRKAFKLYGYRVRKPQLIRYADDFVLLCEELSVVEKAKTIISEWLSEIGLELKPSKTRTAHTLRQYGEEPPGFNFLGFTIRQYPVGKRHTGKNGQGQLLGFKTIVEPSKEKVKEHYKTLAETISEFSGKSQAELIGKLNPIIRGWCNYQTPWNSKKTFQRLKDLVFSKLLRWAKRRHPMKSSDWTIHKYWRRIGNDSWVFSTSRKGENSLELMKHTQAPAGVMHIKVIGNRSPYDGDSIYWSTPMGDTYKFLEPQKARLLKLQKGKCAHCEVHFRPGDRLEKHHKLAKAYGGNNADKNVSLLHLHCHNSIHKEVSHK